MSPRRRSGRETSLAALPAGARGTVVSLTVDETQRRQLYALGLLEGAEVRVVRRARLGGAVLVAAGRSQYALGEDVASRIRVAPG